VVKTLVNAIADRAIIEQGGKHFLDGNHHTVDAANIQEGFLLAGEGRIRQVLCGGGRTNRYRQISVALTNLCIGVADSAIQSGLERRIHHPLADLLTGLGQGDHIIHIQSAQGVIDLLCQIVVLEELAKGFSGGGKTARNGDTRCRQIADHLTEGCIFAAYAFNVIFPQVLKPDYIFRQGRLLFTYYR